jgi:hypothetical protein
VTMIGIWAFNGCSSLTRLSLSPAVYIGEDCFTNCTALIAAAARKNMDVLNLLHYRWRRKPGVYERVNVLLCLKVPLDHIEEERRRSDSEARALQGIKARKKLPKEIWRVILEYL